MPPEYVDYLILGDEHHGETYSDIKSTRPAVRSKYASDAKRTVDDEPMVAPKNGELSCSRISSAGWPFLPGGQQLSFKPFRC